jgi:hypothetical protein
MPSYTKLYPLRADAPYVPAAWAGSWNVDGNRTTVMDGVKYGATGTTTATRAETSATNPLDVGVLRCISRKLSPQTFAGTLDVCIGVSESDAAADFWFRAHLYVINGTTGATLGTVLSYAEASGSGTEFPTTTTGRGFDSPQALTGVVVPNDGDDYFLVAEFGVRSFNAVTTSRTATYRYGGRSTTRSPLSDLTLGSTSSTLASFLEFSVAVQIADQGLDNLTPETATPISTLPESITQNPVWRGSELWFELTIENPVVSVFAGVSSPSGTYTPTTELYRDDGAAGFTAATPSLLEQYRPTILTVGGTRLLLRIFHNGGGPTSRSLVLAAEGPPVQTVGAGSIFITPDAGAGGADVPGLVISNTTGEVLRAVTPFVSTETGAVLADGSRVLVSDKNDRTLLHLYDADLAFLDTLTGILSGGAAQLNSPITTDGETFFVAQQQTGGGTSTVWQLDPDGAVLDTWTLPSDAAALDSIAISPDLSTLYYTRRVDNSGVKRHDMNTDLPLSDLATAGATEAPKDIHALADATILVAFTDQAATNINVIRRYSTGGVLLDEYDFGGVNAEAEDWLIDHFALAEDDPDSFWVWMQTGDLGDGIRRHTFQRIQVSDGSVLTEFSFLDFADGAGSAVAQGDLPETFYQIENSCPLLILPLGLGGGGALPIGIIGPHLWIHFPRRIPGSP